MSKETKDKLVEEIEDLSEDEEMICLYTELSDRELTYNTMLADEVRKAKEEATKEERKTTTTEIAKNMLKKGVSKEVIMDVTGLTDEEMEKLG